MVQLLGTCQKTKIFKFYLDLTHRRRIIMINNNMLNFKKNEILR